MLFSQQCHMDIDDSACPVHKQAYPVPQYHLDVVKCELDLSGILWFFPLREPVNGDYSTSLFPRRMTMYTLISDLHKLNKAFKCKVNPLPIIQYIMH